MMDLFNFARVVRCAAFDFDGVFTDNGVFVDHNGVESVRCSRSDGIGLARLKELGIACVVVSTETNPVVSARCRKLQVDVIQGCVDKVAALRGFLENRRLEFGMTSFLGNDINDLDCLAAVGFPAAVSDAYPEVLAAARWVGTRPGGHGAVREFCDAIWTARQ